YHRTCQRTPGFILLILHTDPAVMETRAAITPMCFNGCMAAQGKHVADRTADFCISCFASCLFLDIAGNGSSFFTSSARCKYVAKLHSGCQPGIANVSDHGESDQCDEYSDVVSPAASRGFLVMELFPLISLDQFIAF